MKKIIPFFSFFLIFGISYAQQASDYFPSQTGFEWRFKVTPLDSLNNPLTSQSVFRIDSFAAVTDYNGKLANIVPTKMGPLQTILIQPFTDSLFYATEGTNGFEYFNISRIEEFLIELDSMGIAPDFSFLDFFTSLQNWYSVYMFDATVNSEYTLKQVDTTITISSQDYDLRFKYSGTRLQDQIIQTVLGSFDCKKFLTKWTIYYLLGPLQFELISTKDSLWIAPDNWIVQDIVPSNPIDLSILGIPPFYIPGLETKMTDEIVTVENEETDLNTFALEQNYPNPFNPTTKISWQSPVGSWQTLKIYDVLGNEIATLVDEEKLAGNYEVDFNAEGLSSGIYFYKLQAGPSGDGFIQTKKMILLK